MKLTNDYTVSGQIFGMSLIAPKSTKIAKKLGQSAADEFVSAKSKLEELAKDVDITFDIVKKSQDGFSGFNIFVNQSYDNVKNPIKRFISYLTDNRFTQGTIRKYDNINAANIISETERTKAKFIKYTT